MILFGLIVIILSSFIFLNLQLVSSQITISPDNTVNDTYINPGISNQGDADFFSVGKYPSSLGELKGLIMFFNLSSYINETDTILDAKLQLYVNDAGFDHQRNTTIKLYLLNTVWSESEANWTNNYATSNWINPGGDYDNSSELNWSKVSNITGIYYNFTIPANIFKGWLTGDLANYGIIITSNDTPEDNWIDFASSNNTDPSQRPRLIINHTVNDVPGIQNISTDPITSIDSRIQTGDSINFLVNWTDTEHNQAQVFICNSTNINYLTGCGEKNFCNTSFDSEGISNCSYNATFADNTTTKFYVGVCDNGSKNCSISDPYYFYVNHAPNVLVVQPNGNEKINQSQGNYLIRFNVSDFDNDSLFASIYYGNSTSLTLITDSSGLPGQDIILDSICTKKPYPKASNCSIYWNSIDIWGTYNLTITVSDPSGSTSNDSSDSSFNVTSIIDTTPPSLSDPWLDSINIHSGKTVEFFVNSSDINPGRVWVSINTTPEINITMSLLTGDTYYLNWTAVETGYYKFKVYSRDKVLNENNTGIFQEFFIRKPNATAQNELYPPLTLPYHLIFITGELNATDSLKGVNAHLNTPPGFTFLNDYPQTNPLGDFDYNQTNTAMWVLSTPHSLGTYSLNITYTDQYGNSYQGNNFNITVTQSIGNGSGGNGGYSIAIAGYPFVVLGEEYSIKAYFVQGGNLVAPDSILLTIKQYNSSTNYKTNMPMENVTDGIYNYTTPIDTGSNEGQWETIINATKDGLSYFATQYWRVVGTLFDVTNITILDNKNTHIKVSVELTNQGQKGTDMWLTYNITDGSGNELYSGSDEYNISSGQTKEAIVETTELPYNISYSGPAKISFIGYYPKETMQFRAMASKLFTISGNLSCGDSICSDGETCSTCPQDCGVCPTNPPGGGGGGGGGAAAPVVKQNKSINITKFEPIIYLTQNINKAVNLEIKNTGTQVLTNISLMLENLNKTFYKINPIMIDSLKPGETKSFVINFFVNNFIGEEDFNYLVSSEDIQVKETGKIIVLSIKDYFEKEIELLEKRINDIKTETSDKKILDSLKNCEKILNESKSYFEKEDYINLDDSLKRTDNCITIIENRLNEKPIITLSNTTWIIISIIFLILLLLIAFAIYYTYKKTRALGVFRSRILSKDEPRIIYKKKTLNEEYFDDKIKNIKDKLKD